MRTLVILIVLSLTILGSLSLLQATKSIADYNSNRAQQLQEILK